MSSNYRQKRRRRPISISSPSDKLIELAQKGLPAPKINVEKSTLLEAYRDQIVVVLNLGLIKLPAVETEWFCNRSYSESLVNFKDYIEGVYYRHNIAHHYWRKSGG